MERPRLLQYVRIAVTPLGLTACVLLVALWVRSYWWCDILENKATRGVIHVESRKGIVIYQLTFYNFKTGWPASTRAAVIEDLSLGRIHTSYPVAESYSFPRASNGMLGFGRFKSGATKIVFAPHWFIAVVTAACAGTPWISRRFSLRTLLIATTLVALGLGMIVYLAG
jgi:hypothetical protein